MSNREAVRKIACTSKGLYKNNINYIWVPADLNSFEFMCTIVKQKNNG